MTSESRYKEGKRGVTKSKEKEVEDAGSSGGW